MLCSLAQRLNYAVVKAEESEMLSLRLGELLKSVMSSGSWYKSGFKRLLRGEKKKNNYHFISIVPSWTSEAKLQAGK